MRRARDPAALRRDRRVRRHRALHRHAGEALLERHAAPARLLGRRPPGARDPDRRRGALGRRRRPSSRSAWIAWRAPRGRGGRSSSSATTSPRCAASATGRMLLSQGQGPSRSATSPRSIDGYIGEVERDLPRSLRERENRDGTGELRFVDMRLERDGQVIDSPTTGEDCDIVLSYEEPRRSRSGASTSGSTSSLWRRTPPSSTFPRRRPAPSFRDVPPRGEARCRLHNCPLPAGQYFMSIWADQAGEMLDGVHRAFEMTVAGGDFYGSGRQPHPDHRTVLVPHDWSVTGPSAPAPGRPHGRDLQSQDLGVALRHASERGLARVPRSARP